MKHIIPLAIPNFEGNELKYATQAVEEGWVSTGGACITTLEEKMASFLRTENAVACQSGTAALHLALIECGVQPGDLVIAPTITFIAAVNPIRYQFADPIFMDCDDYFCIDPVKVRCYLEQKCKRVEGKVVEIESEKEVKAIVVVHVFGNMVDMEAIMDIAKDYGLRVIEDATESLGTKYTQGRYAGCYAGTIGDFGAYSFNGNKIITTGGGGMLIARNQQELAHLKYLSTQAKDDTHFYVHHEVGFNYRMTNVQAAIGVAQMEELEDFIGRKQNNYEYYKKKFENMSEVTLRDTRAGVSSNCWFYALEINVKLKITLRAFIELLQDKGVGTRPIWGLIHQQRPYQQCMAFEMVKAMELEKKIINIPCSTQITRAEQDEVVRVIRECIEEEKV